MAMLIKHVQISAARRNLSGWIRERAAGHAQIYLEGSNKQVRSLIASLQALIKNNYINDIGITRTQPAGVIGFSLLRNSDRPDFITSLSHAALARAKRLESEFADLSNISLHLLNHTKGDQSVLADLITSIPDRFLSQTILRRLEKLNFNILDVACSFSAECWHHQAFLAGLSSVNGCVPESILGDKTLGLAFARKIGLRTPHTYQDDVSFSDIRLRTESVIKPKCGAGGKGVYVIHNDGSVWSVRLGRRLKSMKDLTEDASRWREFHQRDSLWMAQEFIKGENGIPRDIKVYCFYGKAPIILEVDRIGPKPKYCWWSRDGNHISTGKYSNSLFKGELFPSQYARLAEEISLKIPAPFCRIDFLKSCIGPVFGEFTPLPGEFHLFDPKTDAWLGREFAQARAHLVADFIYGKRFVAFEEFVEEHGIHSVTGG